MVGRSSPWCSALASPRCTSTTNADYLNPNDPAWLDGVSYDNSFGGDPMAVMFTTHKGSDGRQLLHGEEPKRAQEDRHGGCSADEHGPRRQRFRHRVTSAKATSRQLADGHCHAVTGYRAPLTSLHGCKK